MLEEIQISGVPLPLPDDVDERMILAGALIKLILKDSPALEKTEDQARVLALAYTFVIANSEGKAMIDPETFKWSLIEWLTSSNEALVLIETLKEVGIFKIDPHELAGRNWGFKQTN